MDNITQEQIDALIEFIDNTEEPASVTNVMAAAILAFLNLKVRQMVTVDDLNNEATARENTDTLLQDLIDALNQTAVRYSDVGEVIAELSTGTGMLLPDQSPLVIFKSMGAAYDGVQRTVTLYEGEASYPGSGNNYKYNKRGTVYPDMTVTSNRVYFNSYTGRLYKWAGSSFEAIGGGMDGAIYDIIKSNVNLVAAKLDALIGALAMLAFSGTVNKESLKVGSLSWVEPETHEPRIITPLDGSTLEFGNSTEDDVDIRIGLFIEGADLTKNLTLSITEGSSRFRLESGSSSITKDAANNGTTIYIIYNSSSSVANATGKLNIHSSEVDVTVNLHGTYSEQGGGETSYQVAAGTLSHVQITETLPATVSSGGSFTGHLVADTDNGYSLPSSIVVSGSHGTVSYDQSSGVFTIPNITSNVAISATAVPSGQQNDYVQEGLVFHLDGQNQGSETGKWIDSVGLKEFVLNGNYELISGKGIKFLDAGDGNSAGYGEYSGDPLYATVDGAIDYNTFDKWTIEVVMTTNQNFSAQHTHGFFSQKSRIDGVGTCPISAALQYLNGSNYMVFGQSSVSSTYKSKRPINGSVFDPLSFIRISQNAERMVVNGVTSTAETEYFRQDAVTYGMRVGTSVAGSVFTANATIHEVRIYNRLLTESEMLQNQQVDSQRYGGN